MVAASSTYCCRECNANLLSLQLAQLDISLVNFSLQTFTLVNRGGYNPFWVMLVAATGVACV